MRIEYHKQFLKSFEKLDRKLQMKIVTRVAIFEKNPLNSLLKNHPLQGSMKGKRAFSVTGDIRVIFEEYGHYTLVLMLDVGSHSQVYG